MKVVIQVSLYQFQSVIYQILSTYLSPKLALYIISRAGKNETPVSIINSFLVFVCTILSAKTLRIVSSNKGGKVLVDKEGYRYLINNHSKDKKRSYWRCAIGCRGGCRGTLTTNYYMSNRIRIKKTGPKHSHEPNYKKIRKSRIVEEPSSPTVDEPSGAKQEPSSPVEFLPDAD